MKDRKTIVCAAFLCFIFHIASVDGSSGTLEGNHYVSFDDVLSDNPGKGSPVKHSFVPSSGSLSPESVANKGDTAQSASLSCWQRLRRVCEGPLSIAVLFGIAGSIVFGGGYVFGILFPDTLSSDSGPGPIVNATSFYNNSF